MRLLRETQQRYGGLAFYNPAVHFGERMSFEPRPDFGGADDEPWIDLIEHTTSIPWSILLRIDGSVAYTVSGPGWTPDGVVKVFGHPDVLIEDAALHEESASRAWKRSEPLSLPDAEHIRKRATGLRLLAEGSGLTQWWWEGEGYRAFLSTTVGRLFPASGRSTCTIEVWADTGRGAQAAEAQLLDRLA
ncbi:hypothetical protein [Actinomadura rugatobispora]|uniref:Uncharacterized protein n=1 Tax=Actinomadura rugatobispora TaxID=1994 RepID=A0ABW0ZUQ4_9ACTN